MSVRPPIDDPDDWYNRWIALHHAPSFGSALVVLGGGDAQIEPLGIVLALCMSLVYTGYRIGTDRNVKRTDPLTAAAWLGIGASLRTSHTRS
ncbi:MAG: hypothetical protein ACXWEN_11370, partial [Actinomycetota bacterium]